MSNYNFKKDLERSNKTEVEVVKILKSHFGKAFIDAKFGEAKKEYDIELITTFQRVRLELKEDFYCKKSGNIAIEFESRGKPSGIETSRSRFWLIKAHTPEGWKLLSIKSDTLRKLIKEERYARIAKGGDNWTSKMYLFALKDIEPYCIIIKEEK